MKKDSGGKNNMVSVLGFKTSPAEGRRRFHKNKAFARLGFRVQGKMAQIRLAKVGFGQSWFGESRPWPPVLRWRLVASMSTRRLKAPGFAFGCNTGGDSGHPRGQRAETCNAGQGVMDGVADTVRAPRISFPNDVTTSLIFWLSALDSTHEKSDVVDLMLVRLFHTHLCVFMSNPRTRVHAHLESLWPIINLDGNLAASHARALRNTIIQMNSAFCVAVSHLVLMKRTSKRSICFVWRAASRYLAWMSAMLLSVPILRNARELSATFVLNATAACLQMFHCSWAQTARDPFRGESTSPLKCCVQIPTTGTFACTTKLAHTWTKVPPLVELLTNRQEVFHTRTRIRRRNIFCWALHQPSQHLSRCTCVPLSQSCSRTPTPSLCKIRANIFQASSSTLCWMSTLSAAK